MDEARRIERGRRARDELGRADRADWRRVRMRGVGMDIVGVAVEVRSRCRGCIDDGKGALWLV